MKSTMQDIELSIADILEHGARNFAESKVFTHYEDGVRETNFASISEKSSRLGTALKTLGVAPGDRVGTLAWNTREHLECYFAIPGLGAVLHTLNPRFSTDQLTWCITDAGTSVIIVDDMLLATLVDCIGLTPGVRAVIHYANGVPGPDSETHLDAIARAGIAVYKYDELVNASEAIAEWVRVPERSAAALCYTSGTTGQPKGVLYSHRSIWLQSLLNTSGAQFGLSRQDTILPAVPMFHVTGWNLLFSAFMVGSNIILTNRSNQAKPLLEAITELRPTFGAGVPTIWGDVAHAYDLEKDGTYDISSLTRISSGGAVVPDGLISWWQISHHVAILHGCGMTETSSTMTSGIPPQGFDFETLSPYQRTQGQFLIGVQSRIVDECGSPLPNDGRRAGELQLRGPWVASGYLNGQGDTLTADGWLPTGDIANISPDGYVTYTDRIKDIIKSGGEWISSVALEAHLAGHAGVREAAVIAVDDDKWQERPAAIIVASGERPAAASLREYVAAAFPKFWVPDHWIFLDALPRTSVGKYDKKLLRERFRSLGNGH
ncbi:long-chain-fatty-acid--CoA ligase [Arthrobacter sp. NicSoilB8]|uniref:long-chain-fatty-acid--CoA ligase n=1 Tax=Arthrobacter sp. NicSoilB8 TaxID=2830998 RepID=UPI001CC62F9A|nr:long-chain-fatty-acid--CoA ligase [Arthrobacter sp. NicSoilB8]BCW73519.1 long-chain-fatty-acid--CoA ligase [Arthrobacter sp. NicSoilB8]